ncbi:S26 family signal peptidase [Streptomyces cyanogenus]|uniref:Peptidase S24-like protein n=1 Tax=Streptomyces cyanogenus TaxID=80860 RepID=A0ABX7TYG6_STRCY|nr:S26 family signal peptidase [Streptomyces cyanogenus]QTE01323.1 Peptidase S24-like protein [Streptomyces cyanogenus]
MVRVLWLMTLAVLGVFAVAMAIFWARRNLVAVTVNGLSMSPTFTTGDRVLVRRGTGGLRRDRIVVVARPDRRNGWGTTPLISRDVDSSRWYIKRAVALGGDRYPSQAPADGVVPAGHLMVIGDNPVSVDSKQHGPCPAHQVLGVVVRRLPRRLQG